ncbi:hypothetical protein OKW30_003513 [Paraburkholderia sp. Clong3]|uniref:PD-(D/E)XK motif protein n=1 Tax=Paraburkholderia sp. Clong3 TaxID=2991061 RepID=UPI003D1E1B64
MARPIKEFSLAWKALSGYSGGDGWRTLPVAHAGPRGLLAGRRFPGNEEAVLIRFDSARLPAASTLPSGQGFSVDRVISDDLGEGWLALSRQADGAHELFEVMVSDVVGVLDACVGSSEAQTLHSFLSRVRGWQSFMQSGSSGMGPEAELGLAGELAFLCELLRAGLGPTFALQAWVGPLRESQDFQIGAGAVEVKSTLSGAGFRAKIGSLDQLDDSTRSPLFLGAARFIESPAGSALPDLAAAVRDALAADVLAVNLFNDRLLFAGYVDAHSERFTRRFTLVDLRFFDVSSGFPKLTPAIVPVGVLRASYEIEVDLASTLPLSSTDVLQRLGVLLA